MTAPRKTDPRKTDPRKPLRLWPGLIAVALLLFARFGLKALIPGFRGVSLGMMWSFGAAAAVLLWWLFLSRARWLERLGFLMLMVVGLGGAWFLRHPSMGPLWMAGYAVPGVCLALVLGAAVARRMPDHPLRVTIAAAIVLGCGVWTLVRSEGISGDHAATFAWRWVPTPEERLLSGAAEGGERPAARSAASAASAQTADWPGFRGPHRDGAVRGVRIETDWMASPPVEIWRRPVGPGWSSFAVSDGLLYTQEQRGDDEVVSCYDAATGQPVWTHRDAARFFESNAGAGPRATPSLHDGRVYTLGATGIVNALDAVHGAVVWSRNAASDTGTTVPYWGYSGSPLIAGDAVVVAASGALVAYDLATGEPRWKGPEGGQSYSSPHLATIAGVEQVLLLNGTGVVSVAPADGALLWKHAWQGFPIVQPALTEEGDVLITAGGDSGTRRIAVARASDGWTAEKRWGSSGLKPYFNDFVVHQGHAYGFDGRILSCIDLTDGRRTWKGGRYGNGQLVLLADQDLLLVLSEEGELALVKAAPDEFTELARFKAIEGKTWNHPVLAGDLLLVRNSQEMAAFRLRVAAR